MRWWDDKNINEINQNIANVIKAENHTSLIVLLTLRLINQQIHFSRCGTHDWGNMRFLVVL